MNKNCRYIDPEGVCTIENRLCDNCHKDPEVTYTAHYNVFEDKTTIKLSYRGKVMISCCVYSQINEGLIKAYALDMAKILVKKGVIK